MKAKVSVKELARRARQRATKIRPRVYTVPFAGAMVGLNRNKSYEAAKAGEIPTMRFGKLLKVPAAVWHSIIGE